VTGVCSTSNVDLVRSIGAEAVIDYNQEDFTRGAWRYHASSTSLISRPARWRTAGAC
jgi:NADPH:quinone reductase-like Zn-dependent oxidoreductase